MAERKGLFSRGQRVAEMQQEVAKSVSKSLERQIAKQTAAEVKKQTEQITTHIERVIEKAIVPTGASAANTPANASMYAPKGVMRYQFNQSMVNSSYYSKKKPDASVPFEVLRKFSKFHEISRACINARKRQIQQLEWDIVSKETDDTTTYNVDDLMAFFQNLGGRGNKYRKFMGRLVEDVLAIDAVALEKQYNRGGQLNTLIPVDATTIRLMVDRSGGTPEPPEIAYKQVIRGEVTAELTDDEMIYDMMNPRTDSPYGFAPLESLMIIVSSSLKAGAWNLAYLTEGNVPEGLFGVPESWTPDMIKEFEENWNGVMAGDEGAIAKLRFVPDGKYTPTKKMDDMAWEQFNDWLMKVTCAIFDVQPTEIGFMPQHGLGGKGMSESQNEITNRRSILPLANFIEEIFTNVINSDFGITELEFKFQGLEEGKDALTEAQVKQIMIETGQRTINELRTDDGLDKIDGLDKPFVMGIPTFIDQKTQDEGKANAAAMQEQLANAKAQPAGETKPAAETPPPAADKPTETAPTTKASKDETFVKLVTELRAFRKYALRRWKPGHSIAPFESEVLPGEALAELNKRINEADSLDDVRGVCREFMQDYQIEFMANVVDFRRDLVGAL